MSDSNSQDTSFRTRGLPDFDSLASKYHSYRKGYSDELFDVILEAVSPHPHVLDLAAGTGLSVEGLRPAAAQIVAADIAPSMLAHASASLRVVARAEAMPFGEATFDVVTCAQAFHWMDPGPTYSEMHRVLEDDGLAAIWWKYPREGDTVRRLTDAAIEEVVGRTPPHTSVVEGELPNFKTAPFELETHQLPFTQNYGLEDWIGYQASREILRREAGEDREAVLSEIKDRLLERFPGSEFEVAYVQHLHLLRPT